MAQPYVGEIRMFAGNFQPAGWMVCWGQELPISEYETLFMLIGTTYGGDGQSTFALPDLRGRLPVHQGNGYVLGEMGGTEQVTLTLQQIPQHSHAPAGAAATGDSPDPAGRTWAPSSLKQFSDADPSVAMAPSALAGAGGSQPHENMPPFLCVTFIISLYGIFPTLT
jgi:microcystin-dependent protein